MAYLYGAYGLTIQSDIVIDFLTAPGDEEPGDAVDEVSICFRPDSSVTATLKQYGWVHHYPPTGVPENGIEISECSGQLKLLYRRDPDSALEFVISVDAKQVTLLRPDQIPEIDGISFFIGPVCGVLSRLRAKTCLHASVLVVDGRAFALTGEKRAGKSTTSAMLTRCGANLLADDIGIISHDGKQFWIEPAYPFMRLAPAAIELTGRSMEDTRDVLSVGDKKYVPAHERHDEPFYSQPMPLDAIYVLSERLGPETGLQIDQLEPNAAARILNSNGYAKYMMDNAMRGQDFALFAKFARDKHSRAVTRPNNLSRLSELAHMIIEDFREIHD
jgi:hypothetical protein